MHISYHIIMIKCLGKAIEESASTCVAVGGKAFSISNSWLMIICQYIIMCRKISKHVQQRSWAGRIFAGTADIVMYARARIYRIWHERIAEDPFARTNRFGDLPASASALQHHKTCSWLAEAWVLVQSNRHSLHLRALWLMLGLD